MEVRGAGPPNPRALRGERGEGGRYPATETAALGLVRCAADERNIWAVSGQLTATAALHVSALKLVATGYIYGDGLNRPYMLKSRHWKQFGLAGLLRYLELIRARLPSYPSTCLG
jgi:hypothetical protein